MYSAVTTTSPAFRFVTVPLLAPVLVVCATIRTIDALRECKTYCSDVDQCTAKTTYTVRMTADNEILPGVPCVEQTNVSFVCANVTTATGLFGLTIEEQSVMSIVASVSTGSAVYPQSYTVLPSVTSWWSGEMASRT